MYTSAGIARLVRTIFFARPQRRAHQVQFFIGILVTQRVFDGPQQLVADVLHGLGDHLVMARLNETLDIDGLAILYQQAQIVDDGRRGATALVGDLLDAVALLIEL